MDHAELNTNPYDRLADIAARRRDAERDARVERLSGDRLEQILRGTANPFVLWLHYNLGRYNNLGRIIRDKVYDIYDDLETRGERAEFNEHMMDGSLIEEAISEIRMEQILRGTADQSLLGEQYNLGENPLNRNPLDPLDQDGGGMIRKSRKHKSRKHKRKIKRGTRRT